jgi:hypothetical protein
MTEALLGRLIRAGFRRGMAGDHWTWFLLGATAYLLRRAARDPGPDHRTIVIRRGESLLVSRAEPGDFPPEPDPIY